MEKREEQGLSDTIIRRRRRGGVGRNITRFPGGVGRRSRGGVSPSIRVTRPTTAPIRANLAYPDFTFNGCPVVRSPKIIMSCWGPNWDDRGAHAMLWSRLERFVEDLLTSRYMGILWQYGVGPATLVKPIMVTDVPSQLNDASTINIIQKMISDGKIPEPSPIDNDTVILVYLDETIEFNQPGETRMCEPTDDNAFGFHSSFVTRKGNDYFYAVIPTLDDTCLKRTCPDDSKCSLKLAQTQEQRLTQVTTHELAEMLTDPIYTKSWWGPDADEIGDICNGQAATIAIGENQWDVQQIYSMMDDENSNGDLTCVIQPPVGIFKLGAGVVLAEKSSAGPSIVSHNGQLFIAWKGSNNDFQNIMLSPDNGQTFQGKLTVSTPTDHAPALASHGGKLLIAWKRTGDDRLCIAEIQLAPNDTGSYDIQQFVNQVILGYTSSEGPAFASHNGVLYLAWKGAHDDGLSMTFSVDGGNSFMGKSTFTERSSAGPGLASHNGKLLITWKGSGNDWLNVAEVMLSSDGSIQGLGNKQIIREKSDVSPALVSHEGLLLLAWKGLGSHLNMMASVDDGLSFYNKPTLSDTTGAAPSLASHSGDLLIAWKESGNDKLDVAQIVIDGDLTALPFQEDLAGRNGSIVLGHQFPYNQLDIVMVDQDGSLSALRALGQFDWQGPVRLTGPGFAPPGAPVALAHQASYHQIDAMVVDNLGRVVIAYAVDDGAWNGPMPITGEWFAIPGAYVALAHEVSMNRLDAFIVDSEGSLQMLWADGTGAWQGPLQLSEAGFAPPGTPVALAHQVTENKLTAALVAHDGALYVLWVAGDGQWQGPMRLTGPGFAKPGTPVALAHQVSMNQLDAVLVGSDGAVYFLWATGDGAWHEPVPITSGQFAAPGTPVALGTRASCDPLYPYGQLDAVLVGLDGAVHVLLAKGFGAWQGPEPLTARGFTSPGAPVALAHQGSLAHLDAIVADGKGALNILQVVASGSWQGPAILPGGLVLKY